MSLIGRSLFYATHRLRGSRSLELFEQIRHAPRAPAERVREEQLRRLRRLLEHAETRVPYYRELFAGLGIGSRDIRSLADLAQLPVLTKELVRERQRDLVREDVPLGALSQHHSGGSTGVPLTFYRDAAYMDASTAGTYRNFSQAGWRPGEMVAFFWGWNQQLNEMPRWKFELRQWARRFYQFDPFQSGPAEMERWLRRWRTLRPRVALGYASTIDRFAAHAEAAGARLPPLRGVFTTAEKLYPQQRERLARVFGCPVFDCYGSSEVQNIASECPHGSMHVNADFVVLEAEPSAEPGAPQPLLVTSLLNYAMPFIRYRNADGGALVEGACACGGGFPLMSLGIARVSDNFVLPNGRVVHGEFFTHLLYGSAGIASFQFHQRTADEIVLWYVPGPGDGERRRHALRSACAATEALAPGLLRVEARETAAIPLSSAGKHRFTRSDVAAAQLAGR